ncbi:MAG TPA: glycosyltransferase family 4 protein [Solirubrobacteraceae bacterium]|nr:glycosyltransferase family 4 protein [Solirubrobacteraceae bacterium]
MRVLFFNEGNSGSYIMGLAQGEAAMQVGLATRPELEAHFAQLTPMDRWATALAARPVPLLSRAKLDFHTLRWHVVQSLRARSQLRQELRDWPADVVYVKTQSIALAMTALMRRLPVVLSIDATVRDWWAMPAWSSANGDSAVTIAPSQALERRAMRSAALVLAWTAWARRAAERDAPGARVVEHHPGIDLLRYAPAAKRPRERVRVLFVGGRFVEKGGEDLLAALGEKIGREVDLDLVTPSPVVERPGVRVHRLEASDPALLDLYQQADLLVLPTYGDTNPWVLLEAMACGTPVVSTAVGGIPDMLEEGRAGVLVPYGDRHALRQALDALLADPDRRAQLARRGRLRCEEHYDARKQIVRFEAYLREVCANGSSGS